MKITKIEQQKRNKNRYSLYSEEGYFMSADAYVIKKYHVEEGKSYEESDLARWIEEDETEKAKSYTVDYLLGKTEKEIRTKLAQKGYEAPVIERVLAFLHKYRYIDDQGVAKALLNDGVKLKKEGRNKIKQKMMQKGIAKNDMETVMEGIDEKAEKEAARYQLQKVKEKYKQKAKSAYEWKAKCYQFLLRKGFPYDVATGVAEEEKWDF